MAAKKNSSRKRAASPAAAETSATSAASDTPRSSAAKRGGTKRGGGKRGSTRAGGRNPGDRPAAGIVSARTRRPIDPLAVPASRTEVEDVRAGRAKPDNKKPLPRPITLSPRATILNPGDEKTRVPNAEVVDVEPDDRRQLKGYREETVVATRMGHYGHKRRRQGEVFTMAFVGDGYLPSWVKLANKEDQDPEVSRSRQVVSNSTGEEIRADVARDAGTEVPTYLGGNQRRPTNQSGDVL